MYLFLSLKGRQSSILWSVLCRFHWLYHSCHSLSLDVTRCITRCHSLSLVAPLVVIRCHSLYYSLSLVVIRCHLLSLDVPLVCLFINDRFLIEISVQYAQDICKSFNMYILQKQTQQSWCNIESMFLWLFWQYICDVIFRALPDVVFATMNRRQK